MTHIETTPTIDLEDKPERQRNNVLKVWAATIRASQNFLLQMEDSGFPTERLLTSQSNEPSEVEGITAYQAQSMIFNTRYHYHPFVIVMCQSTEDVQLAYRCAIANKLPIKVRSGGHDHAGECSGDNVILLDLSGLKHFDIDPTTQIATIGSGYRFYQLTPKLADQDRMIAHGTCATVGLAGFIQGGGWGPWTRKYGMCCEHLVGATLILGNGERIEVSEAQHPRLLWALRGGGAMSYGIVTEFKVKTFPLPEEIHRFEIAWNQPLNNDGSENVPTYPALKILQAWEKVILSENTSGLLGTNLKVNALSAPWPPTEAEADRTKNHCLMYGYWEGDKEALSTFISRHFASVPVPPSQIKIHPAGGSKEKDPAKKYDAHLMGDWDRNSLFDVLKQKQPLLKGGLPLLGGKPFKPDYDAPAPHKITSKLVSEQGLTPKGHRQLLQSLASPLLSEQNEEQGLFAYVTLGAITGDYYHTHPEGESTLGVAFPYQRSQYTIQYQTWWNEDIRLKEEQQNNPVYRHTNRAMDWIDSSRENSIEGAYGAFISFKDPAIPTKTYFQENYPQLLDIKQEYAQDPYNHLRSRKTIE